MKRISFPLDLKKRPHLLPLMLLFSVGYGQSDFKVEVGRKGTQILRFPGFGCLGDVWKDITGKLAKNEKPWLPKIKEAIVQYVHTQ
jgi:hypothetical protein